MMHQCSISENLQITKSEKIWQLNDQHNHQHESWGNFINSPVCFEVLYPYASYSYCGYKLTHTLHLLLCSSTTKQMFHFQNHSLLNSNLSEKDLFLPIVCVLFKDTSLNKEVLEFVARCLPIDTKS